MKTAIAPLPPPAVRRVPVRSLSPRHRPRILAHLIALPPRDRYLRFGHVASDAQISRYVDQIDFDRDEVFGIFNRRLQLLAMAHLADLGPEAPPAGVAPSASAEFGVSVDQRARGRGWGARLFEHAVLHARNRHVDTLIIHALTENSAMLHIARRAGAQVHSEGPDAMARLKLPPEDLASHIEALVEHQVAEFDYGWKRQARRVGAWLHLFDDKTIPEAAVRKPPTHTQARGPGS